MAAVILQLQEARPVCLLYVWSSLKNKAIWAKEASFYHKKHHLSDFVPDVNIFIYLNIFIFYFGQYGICVLCPYFWYKRVV